MRKDVVPQAPLAIQGRLKNRHGHLCVPRGASTDVHHERARTYPERVPILYEKAPQNHIEGRRASAVSVSRESEAGDLIQRVARSLQININNHILRGAIGDTTTFIVRHIL